MTTSSSLMAIKHCRNHYPLRERESLACGIR
jgi:hypothetical protein